MARRSPPKRLNRIEPDLGTILDSLPESRNYKREILQQQLEKEKEKKSATRGWRAASPQKGKERHEISQVCGADKCFLIPGQEKFPICPSLRTTKGKCGVDCRALQSAVIRGKQYNYPQVVKKAEQLQAKYHCDKEYKAKSPRGKRHDLSELTVVELKEKLRARGLKVSGNKQELIDRLNEYQFDYFPPNRYTKTNR